ncbi:MAG: cell division protein ZapA [Flavobacteriales bacterium]|nr:cell division protein ZapA [Flavobacteriales bacterium]
MEEVSIKVTIAGRTYPLTIEKQQEPVIRDAEKRLGESIELFQKSYAVKDKQDLLAMAALQVLAANLQEVPPQVSAEELNKALEKLEKSIDTHLS